jgi:hypothetical protein
MFFTGIFPKSIYNCYVDMESGSTFGSPTLIDAGVLLVAPVINKY